MRSEWEISKRSTRASVWTYALSLTHLMKVGSPANNHDLSIAWIAQVSRQLPLSGAVPAHVEEDLDDDKYYNHSDREREGGGKQAKTSQESRIKHNTVKSCLINEAKYIKNRRSTHMYQ